MLKFLFFILLLGAIQLPCKNAKNQPRKHNEKQNSCQEIDTNDGYLRRNENRLTICQLFSVIDKMSSVFFSIKQSLETRRLRVMEKRILLIFPTARFLFKTVALKVCKLFELFKIITINCPHIVGILSSTTKRPLATLVTASTSHVSRTSSATEMLNITTEPSTKMHTQPITSRMTLKPTAATTLKITEQNYDSFSTVITTTETPMNPKLTTQIDETSPPSASSQQMEIATETTSRISQLETTLPNASETSTIEVSETSSEQIATGMEPERTTIVIFIPSNPSKEATEPSDSEAISEISASEGLTTVRVHELTLNPLDQSSATETSSSLDDRQPTTDSGLSHGSASSIEIASDFLELVATSSTEGGLTSESLFSTTDLTGSGLTSEVSPVSDDYMTNEVSSSSASDYDSEMLSSETTTMLDFIPEISHEGEELERRTASGSIPYRLSFKHKSRRNSGNNRFAQTNSEHIQREDKKLRISKRSTPDKKCIMNRNKKYLVSMLNRIIGVYHSKISFIEKLRRDLESFQMSLSNKHFAETDSEKKSAEYLADTVKLFRDGYSKQIREFIEEASGYAKKMQGEFLDRMLDLLNLLNLGIKVPDLTLCTLINKCPESMLI